MQDVFPLHTEPCPNVPRLWLTQACWNQLGEQQTAWSFVWRWTLDYTPNTYPLKQKGQCLGWSHDSSLYKCFGKRFCRKVSLEVSIAKNMRLRDGIDTSNSAVKSFCSSKHPCRHCLQFIAPSSRSKLTPFMLFSPQTSGWNVTSLTIWNLLRSWYDDPAPKVQNSASGTVRANFSEMLNPAILKQGD